MDTFRERGFQDSVSGQVTSEPGLKDKDTFVKWAKVGTREKKNSK